MKYVPIECDGGVVSYTVRRHVSFEIEDIGQVLRWVREAPDEYFEIGENTLVSFCQSSLRLT